LPRFPGPGGDCIEQRVEERADQHLCQNQEWNEELIDKRSADLAGRIMRTSPGPGPQTWPSTAFEDEAEEATTD
jgi:hypothetical protein